MNVRFASVVFAVLALAGNCLAGSEQDWIAKARAYLGTDKALDAVTNIHFTGTLELVERVPSEEDPNVMVERPLQLPVDIVFQKPYQQRITVSSERVVEVTALDGYDAWQRRTDPDNSSQWQLTLLDPQQVKRLRANTWENLNFFRGIERHGGRVEFQGDVTADGVACVKLAFIHAENIVFFRFFDKETGRLVKTETESGGEIREEGVVTIAGVRFPKKVINRSPTGQTTTITFNTVQTNESIPPDQFAVPDLMPR